MEDTTQAFLFATAGPATGPVVDPTRTPPPPPPPRPAPLPDLDPVQPGKRDTSAKAAEKIAPSRGKVVRRILRMIAEAEPTRCGATAEELAAALNMKIQTVSARLAELHAKEAIAPRRCRACGGVGCDAEWRGTFCRDGELKRRNASGAAAAVWKIGFRSGVDREGRRHDGDGDVGRSCGPNDRRVLKLVRDAGQIGVTCKEAERRLRMRHTTASPIFTKARKNGWIIDTGKRRDGAAVYAIGMAGLGALN